MAEIEQAHETTDSVASDTVVTKTTIETEETLLERARGALSSCNWEVGECAARWTEKYARGRTDADFGSQIGLSGDQVYQRRRVWETFHDVQHEYAGLKWSHFYVAINWSDSAECLSWAMDNQATVAEMKAWRRAIHGEDLTTDPDPEALQALDYDNVTVRAAQGEGGSRGDVPFAMNDEDGEYATAVSGEATPYAPFRKDARGASFEGDDGNSQSMATRPSADVSPLRMVKRAIGGLRRIQQQLAELTAEDYHSLSPEVINELWDVYEELGLEIKRQA